MWRALRSTSKCHVNIMLLLRWTMFVLQGYEERSTEGAGWMNWFPQLQLTSYLSSSTLQFRIWCCCQSCQWASASWKKVACLSMLSLVLLGPAASDRFHQVLWVSETCKQILREKNLLFSRKVACKLSNCNLKKIGTELADKDHLGFSSSFFRD